MYLEEMIKYSDHKDGLEDFYQMALRVACEAPEGIPFLEIGTREGGSALILLKAIKDSRVKRSLITVDPYGRKPYFTENVEPPPQYEGLKLIEVDHREDYYRRAACLIAQYALQQDLDHFHFHIESEDFMKTFPMMKIWWEGNVLQQRFAFVYLDGEHTISAVSKEIEWFLPKMIDDGIIVIDDVENIKDSDNELLQKVVKEGEMIGGVNRIFYTVKRKE